MVECSQLSLGNAELVLLHLHHQQQTHNPNRQSVNINRKQLLRQTYPMGCSFQIPSYMMLDVYGKHVALQSWSHFPPLPQASILMDTKWNISQSLSLSLSFNMSSYCDKWRDDHHPRVVLMREIERDWESVRQTEEVDDYRTTRTYCYWNDNKS